MKITKNAEKPVEKPAKETPVVAAKTNYDRSRTYIKAAIDCLGTQAKDDVLAKEAIANLSVILLDLQ